jgi:hypothetical protein
MNRGDDGAFNEQAPMGRLATVQLICLELRLCYPMMLTVSLHSAPHVEDFMKRREKDSAAALGSCVFVLVIRCPSALLNCKTVNLLAKLSQSVLCSMILSCL